MSSHKPFLGIHLYPVYIVSRFNSTLQQSTQAIKAINNMQPSISDSLSNDTSAMMESLSAMMQKEQAVYKIYGYLHSPIQDSTITESDRLKIVDWCYCVVDQWEFDRETVAMAMELVDRFLSH